MREDQRKFERKKVIGGIVINKVRINVKTKKNLKNIGWNIGRVGNDNILPLRVEEADIVSTQ